MKSRLVLALNDYEKYSAPSRKGPYVFFRKNEGASTRSPAMARAA